MNVKKYLDQVSYTKGSDILSKFDDSYMTRVGMEDNVKFLADREITEELTHGVGFSPKDNRWYGWSHRAIHGFEIGSTCKKGDCHYNGSNAKEREQAAIDFWVEPSHKNVVSNGIITEGENEYFDIQWEYVTDERLIPNKSLHGTLGGCKHYVTPLGRGEWTAKTMEDAKQMAVDFNEGVS